MQRFSIASLAYRDLDDRFHLNFLFTPQQTKENLADNQPSKGKTYLKKQRTDVFFGKATAFF
jgi:hypothetical protein